MTKEEQLEWLTRKIDPRMKGWWSDCDCIQRYEDKFINGKNPDERTGTVHRGGLEYLIEEGESILRFLEENNLRLVKTEDRVGEGDMRAQIKFLKGTLRALYIQPVTDAEINEMLEVGSNG